MVLPAKMTKLGLVVLTTIQNLLPRRRLPTEEKTGMQRDAVRHDRAMARPHGSGKSTSPFGMRTKWQATSTGTAIKFYHDNRDAMDAGVLMPTNHFKKHVVKGEQLVFSAIQQSI